MATLATNINTGQANHPSIHNAERTQINANTNEIAAQAERLGGVITPADHGLIAWSFDPAASDRAAAYNFTSGTARVVLIYVPQPATITNIHTYVQQAGTSMVSGQSFAALYEADDDLLRVTADQSSAWASTGEKIMPLASTYTLATPGYLKVVMWSVFSGTAVGLARSIGAVSSSLLNFGMAPPLLRSSTANTGLTTTAPATLGAQTAVGGIPLVGLS
jgi:hypothetical protein